MMSWLMNAGECWCRKYCLPAGPHGLVPEGWVLCRCANTLAVYEIDFKKIFYRREGFVCPVGSLPVRAKHCEGLCEGHFGIQRKL